MKNNNRTILYIGLIVAVIATRFLPHAPNFTAIGATALFGGFIFKNHLKAFLIPAATLFISDLLINNVIYSSFYEGFQWLTPGFAFIYGAFFITVLMGKYFTKGFKPLPLVASGLASAVVFYLLTNFGAWLISPVYAPNFFGLMQSYIAGLPFLLNQLMGTAMYGVVLFGTAWYFVGSRSMRTVNA